MNSEKNMKDVYTMLMNETLLRYLVYNQRNPLSPSLTDVLTLPDSTKVIDNHIKMTPKTSDLTSESKISRLCMYLGNRSPQNRKVSNQDVIFDIYVHEDIDLQDLRLSLIRDYISKLIEDKHITGLGRSELKGAGIIANSPSGYVGYRMAYTFGSGIA